MAQYFYTYSDSPFAIGQSPPADHSAQGQRTGDFEIVDAPDTGWNATSEGGNALEFLGGGLNNSSTYLRYDSGLGSTIASEGPDTEIVERCFRGGGGTGGFAEYRKIVRSHNTQSNHYEIGLREGGVGALNATIVKRENDSDTTLAETEIAADHNTAFPIDTETWMRVRSWDVGGTVELKVRFWVGAAGDEPASWDLETTDATFHGVTGNIGYQIVRGEFHFDAVGVGTGGDPAPTAPVSSGVSGTAAQTLPSTTQSASGTLTFTASADQTFASLTQSASGSTTGAVSGSAAQTLPSITQDSTGTLQFSGTSSQLMAAITQSASGGLTFTGSAAQTLSFIIQSASGTTDASRSGSITQTLPVVTQDSTGTLTFTATNGGQELPAVTQTAQETIKDVRPQGSKFHRSGVRTTFRRSHYRSKR